MANGLQVTPHQIFDCDGRLQRLLQTRIGLLRAGKDLALGVRFEARMRPIVARAQLESWRREGFQLARRMIQNGVIVAKSTSEVLEMMALTLESALDTARLMQHARQSRNLMPRVQLLKQFEVSMYLAHVVNSVTSKPPDFSLDKRMADYLCLNYAMKVNRKDDLRS